MRPSSHNDNGSYSGVSTFARSKQCSNLPSMSLFMKHSKIPEDREMLVILFGSSFVKGPAQVSYPPRNLSVPQQLEISALQFYCTGALHYEILHLVLFFPVKSLSTHFIGVS